MKVLLSGSEDMQLACGLEADLSFNPSKLKSAISHTMPVVSTLIAGHLFTA